MEHGGREQDVAVHRGVGRAVEKGVHRIKVLRGDWIKLVVMAHGTTRGEPHPNGHGGFGAVDSVAKQ